MAASAAHIFTNAGVNPIYPLQARRIHVALDASVTLAAGTVLGEIQKNDTYTISTGSQGSGTFTLTFGGQTTSALARTASASTVQTAVLALSTVGTGNATVTLTSGTPGTDAVYTLILLGTLAHTANGAVTADFSSLATPGNASLTKTITGQRLGTYKAYNDSNTDGSQVAKLILEFACATDSSSNITFGTSNAGGPFGQTCKTCPAFIAGEFYTSELTGLDANGIADMGHLIEGTLAAGGILKMH